MNVRHGLGLGDKCTVDQGLKILFDKRETIHMTIS